MESNEWMFNVYLVKQSGEELVYDGEPDWGEGTPIYFLNPAEAAKIVADYKGDLNDVKEIGIRRVRNPYSLSTVEGQKRFLRAMQVYFEHR